MTHNFQVNASYTYSHSLDEGSGIGAGLFFNGNDPLHPRSSYASSDFDRTHVFSISYLYNLPTIKDAHGLVNAIANGWGVTGVTVAESGEPFSVIDFSGTAGGLFYSADDFVTNPILPLAPGVTPDQAVSGMTINGSHGGSLVNGQPYVNPNVFTEPLLQPGQDGVPPCQTISGTPVCDMEETGFGSTGRNVFRSPFQTNFNLSIFKNFKLSERFGLKFQADAFNLFNHPSSGHARHGLRVESLLQPRTVLHPHAAAFQGLRRDRQHHREQSVLAVVAAPDVLVRSVGRLDVRQPAQHAIRDMAAWRRSRPPFRIHPRVSAPIDNRLPQSKLPAWTHRKKKRPTPARRRAK